MKRRVVYYGLLLVLVLFSCKGPQGTTSATETFTVSYESLAMVAFPTVRAYLAAREANGTLSGDALTKAKNTYAQARTDFLKAGDMMVLSIQSPGAATLMQVQTALQAVAVTLASLSGGNVQGNQMTIPAVGGATK